MNLPNVEDIYVSVIPSRRNNEIRVHTSLGYAKSAVRNKVEMVGRYSADTQGYVSMTTYPEFYIYRIENMEWVLVYSGNIEAKSLPWDTGSTPA